MSRLAKKPIPVPDKVSVKIDGTEVTLRGPAGEASRQFRRDIAIVEKDKAIVLTPQTKTKEAMALWGTYASEIKSMLKGVVTPFTKKLVLEGIGFKSEVKTNELVFSLGFTHQVKISIPKNVTATAVKNVITVSSVDKELVGRFAAEIRSLKKPEPYKGKGIHYEGEVIRRKEGKKTV